MYHAYQMLKRGGLSDSRIVVMHCDDIAHNPSNPHPGKVINIPGGDNVYAGVPKDYTGEDVTAEAFLAVLSGNRSGVAHTKGSKKVLSPTMLDEVFLYFADHGGPGILGMPNPPFLTAGDLVATLTRMAGAGDAAGGEGGASSEEQGRFNVRTFKTMTVYIEACESGSIFDGLLPSGLGIYATTAANPTESSWGTYCPG